MLPELLADSLHKLGSVKQGLNHAVTPHWHLPVVECRFTDHARVVVGGITWILGEACPGGLVIVCVPGSLPEDCRQFTVIGGQVVSKDQPWIVCRCNRTEVIAPAGQGQAGLDAFAGVGVFGAAMHQRGYEIALAIEHASLPCAHHLLKHATSIHQGEFHSRSSLVKQIQHGIGWSIAGYPCQPFSQCGHRAGFQDPRGLALGHIAIAAHLQGWHTIGLECVAEAGAHPCTKAIIQWICESLQLQFVDTTHALSTTIPVSGQRWLAVLGQQVPQSFPTHARLASTLAELNLPWPSEAFSAEAWEDVLLREDELIYLQYTSSGVSIVKGQGKLRRPLHSATNHFRACPCGCRQYGFSPSSLQQKCLQEIVATDQAGIFRFLHHNEVWTATGGTGKLPWENRVRSTLPLLGNAPAAIHAKLLAEVVGITLSNGNILTSAPTEAWIELRVSGRNFRIAFASKYLTPVEHVIQQLADLGWCTHQATLQYHGCQLLPSTPIQAIGFGPHEIILVEPPPQVIPPAQGFGPQAIRHMLSSLSQLDWTVHEDLSGFWHQDRFCAPVIISNHWCWAVATATGECDVWHASKFALGNAASIFLAMHNLRLASEHACDLQECEGQCGPCLPSVFLTAFGRFVTAEQHRTLCGAATQLCASFAVNQPAEVTTGAGVLAKHNQALTALLTAKGVPQQLVDERIAGLCQVVPQARIESSLKLATARLQWASLCEAAGSQFRLVTPEESKSNKRARHQLPAQGEDPLQKHDPWQKAATQRKSGQPANLGKLEVDNLTCQDGIFTTDASTAIAYLTLDQVVADATGVCVASADQAQPFLKNSKNLSAYPLALFVLEAEQLVETNFAKAACNVPATVKDTSTSVVLLGTLVQLGDSPVIRYTSPNACKLMPPASVTAHPVRQAIAGLPTIAGQNNCLLDYWGHRSSAQSLTFKIRVAESVADALRKESGSQFIFIDDIRPDQGGTAAEWIVVWLPDQTHAEVKAKMQMHATVSGLVVKNPGVGQTFGLRVLPDHATELRLQVDPRAKQGDGYIPIGKHYLIQPLPPGCDQQTIQGLLDSIKWTAKPLKPAGRHAYRVGATSQPPVNTIPHITGDIIITEVARPGAKAKAGPQARALVQTAASSQSQGPTPAAAIPRVSDIEQRFNDRLAAVEQRLQSQVDQALGQVTNAVKTQQTEIGNMRSEVQQTRADVSKISQGYADIGQHLIKLTSAFEQQSQQLQDLIAAGNSTPAHKVRVTQADT